MATYKTNTRETGGKAPTAIVYMPEGRHNIKATINGKPGERVVNVTRECVAALKADLAEKLKAKTKPVVYYDHAAGPVAYHPTGFDWEDGKGVILLAEPTKQGAEAIEGKSYCYFSPNFMLDESGNVAGLNDASIEVGSLVNEPAFEALDAIAASKSSLVLQGDEGNKTQNPDNQTKTQTNMNEIAKLLGLAEGADEAAVIDAINKLKAAQAAASKEAGDKAKADEEAKKKAEEAAAANKSASEKDAELKKEQENCAAAKAALKELREQVAENGIKAAIAAGKIPPKDEEAIKTWQAMYKADPVSASKALSKLAANAALSTVAAGKVDEGDKGATKSLADIYAEESK